MDVLRRRERHPSNVENTPGGADLEDSGAGDDARRDALLERLPVETNVGVRHVDVDREPGEVLAHDRAGRIE